MEDYRIKSVIKGNCAIVHYQGREKRVSFFVAKNWIRTMEETDPEDYALQIQRFKKIVHAIETGS